MRNVRLSGDFLNLCYDAIMKKKQEAQRATYRAPEYNVPAF